MARIGTIIASLAADQQCDVRIVGGGRQRRLNPYFIVTIASDFRVSLSELVTAARGCAGLLVPEMSIWWEGLLLLR